MLQPFVAAVRPPGASPIVQESDFTSKNAKEAKNEFEKPIGDGPHDHNLQTSKYSVTAQTHPITND